MKSVSSVSMGGLGGVGSGAQNMTTTTTGATTTSGAFASLASNLPNLGSLSSAQLLSLSSSNIENRDSLLLTNKPARGSRAMKIPDFTQLRKDLLYPLKEEIILPQVQSASKRLVAPAVVTTSNNNNNAAAANQNISIVSNEMNFLKSHVRFDNSREEASTAVGGGGAGGGEFADDAATRSSYSSDDTSDLMSEARSYAEIDDERAEIMRLFFGEARYRPEGMFIGGGGIQTGGAMTASGTSIGAADDDSSPDGRGARKMSMYQENDYFRGHFDQG